MANTGFGARELTLLSGGTPTISVPAQLDIKATTVGISTGLTVGAAATFSSTLNVTDIATFTRINANEVNAELYFKESDDSNKTCNIPFMNAAQSGNTFAWLEVDHSVLTFNPSTNILTTNGLLATGNVTTQGNYLGDGASLTGIVTTLVAGNGINISDTTGQITITNSSVGIGSDVSINTTGIISAFAFDSSGTGDPVIRVGSGTTLNLEAPIVAISTDLTVGGTSTLAILESPRPNLPEIYAGAGSTITLSATQVAITTNCAIGGDVTVTNIGLSGNLNGSDGTININSNVLNFYNNAFANKLLEINHTSGFVAVSTNFSAPQYETSSTTYGNGTDRGYSITYNITANGSSSYSFAGPGIVNTRTNPVIYLQRGFTYNLVNTTGSHPFRIQYAGTTTGYGSTYLSGSQTGTQTFTVPFDAPSTLEYECSSHASMKGDIIIPFTNTTGNTANGYHALYSNTTGNYNTANGYNALYSNTTGNYNTANGYNAIYTNTTGGKNTANGFYALYTNTTGNYNTANGYFTLQFNTTGGYNTALGNNALRNNTTGGFNTAVGSASLESNTTGSSNVANGYEALYSNTTGYNNTANGLNALNSNTTGVNNTANGVNAGYGDGTQANTTGSNNIFLGFDAMGASATASNVITFGNSSIATLRCQVTTITALSDARDKTNITNIPAGLDFINALRPVAFDWNMRDGKKVGIHEFGFIAQELQEAQASTGITVPNLVSTENPDKLEASAGTLLPVLVNAVQELTAMVRDLQAELSILKGS